MAKLYYTRKRFCTVADKLVADGWFVGEDGNGYVAERGRSRVRLYNTPGRSPIIDLAGADRHDADFLFDKLVLQRARRFG